VGLGDVIPMAATPVQAHCTPLQQWRQAGRWPACLDAIWRELEQRHGKSKGTREMIALVRAGSAHFASG